MAQEQQQQQQSPTFQRADTVEELSVPFDLAHQRAQELEKFPSGREGSDDESSRTPRVRVAHSVPDPVGAGTSRH